MKLMDQCKVFFQHNTLCQRADEVTCGSSGRAVSHWVLPGHCPQHLPQQLRKLGEGGPQLLLPPNSYPNLHMSPPLDLLRVWSGPAKITTLCEKKQWIARVETDPFVFKYKVYQHIAKNGRGVNEI